MTDEELIELYQTTNATMTELAGHRGVSIDIVRRILKKNNIPIVKKPKTYVITDEHRKKISDSRKKSYENGEWIPWAKGKSMSKSAVLKNMKAHLQYDVSLEWLETFDDIERLKYLNRSISRKRDSEGFTTETYVSFIEKFYNDPTFTKLYNTWQTTGDKWIKPSLDHIISKAGGCDLTNINNMQFISWFANRSKVDMTEQEWTNIKENINHYL